MIPERRRISYRLDISPGLFWRELAAALAFLWVVLALWFM